MTSSITATLRERHAAQAAVAAGGQAEGRVKLVADVAGRPDPFGQLIGGDAAVGKPAVLAAASVDCGQYLPFSVDADLAWQFPACNWPAVPSACSRTYLQRDV